MSSAGKTVSAGYSDAYTQGSGWNQHSGARDASGRRRG